MTYIEVDIVFVFVTDITPKIFPFKIYLKNAYQRRIARSNGNVNRNQV
jgi:hypothetical protein